MTAKTDKLLCRVFAAALILAAIYSALMYYGADNFYFWTGK